MPARIGKTKAARAMRAALSFQIARDVSAVVPLS